MDDPDNGGFVGRRLDEDQFYLIWPLILIVASKFLNRRRLVWMTLTMAALSVVDSIYLYASGASFHRLLFGPDLVAAQLLIGCAAGLLFTEGAFDRVADSPVWR